jgi:hypothetical protein
LATGLSSDDGAASVSTLRASIPNAGEFIRTALRVEIAAMLDELGQPPLVARIFPKGWQNADREGLTSLYELCRRTFIQREKGNG